MQSLGLTPQTPSEGRLKSLLWPTVNNDADVDNLTTQGFWICVAGAVFTLIFNLMRGKYFLLQALFFYLGGNGVRERSKAAAIAVFGVIALQTFGNPGILGFIFTAILLSNVRAIWIASARKNQGEFNEPPIVLDDTFADKLSGKWPPILWPKIRILFFILAAVEVAGVLATLLLRL